MRNLFSSLFIIMILSFLMSCSKTKPVDEEPDLAEAIARLSGSPVVLNGDGDDLLHGILSRAEIPGDMSIRIAETAAGNPAFILELLICLECDPDLRRLVDKQHPLPADYEPDDLVELGAAQNSAAQSSTVQNSAQSAPYRVSRAGLLLRKPAADSLAEMAAAARAGGVLLTASSAYRSYSYQEQLYSRNVQEMGREAADRESARPGFSQHQTGLALDFGAINDSFAGTAEGRWMAANASRFGWSLSFPDGYEWLTGYRWESWHYRYVGLELAAFIDTYFDGIQQYALRFIYEWERSLD
jgi:D-alanyl-D-alanine carboxypeptidase